MLRSEITTRLRASAPLAATVAISLAMILVMLPTPSYPRGGGLTPPEPGGAAEGADPDGPATGEDAGEDADADGDADELEAPIDELEASDPPVADPLPGSGSATVPDGSGMPDGGADPALFDTGLSAEELALLEEVELTVAEADGNVPETGPAGPDGDAPTDATVVEMDPEQAAGDDDPFAFGGHLGLEYLQFLSSPSDSRQPDGDLSLVVNPEFSYRWIHADSGRRHTLNISPFYRLDQHDDERSHFDVRELNLLSVGDRWNLRIGAGKVFWGATETVHWVDVINQSDLVENIDGEDKLGQPMLNLNLTDAEHGTLGLFVLPYFRERTFPGVEGRPRTIPRILEDEAIYESSAGQWHTDFALRWEKSLGNADIGLAYFYGTSREPSYVPELAPGSGEILLHPLYEIIHQGSLDVQYALDDWLLKLESVYRSGQGDEDYLLAAGGFEYTFHRILGSQADLGLISEMLYDSRGSNNLNPYEHDLALGFRLGMNDLRDTEVLFAAITDLRDGSTTLSLEASLRLKDQWRLAIEARAFGNIPPGDFPLNGMRNDQSLQVGLEYHF